jgi:hypothetical protein
LAKTKDSLSDTLAKIKPWAQRPHPAFTPENTPELPVGKKIQPDWGHRIFNGLRAPGAVPREVGWKQSFIMVSAPVCSTYYCHYVHLSDTLNR